MKASAFLRRCAELHFRGVPIPHALRAEVDAGWSEFLILTMPTASDDKAFPNIERHIDETRPMRFALAAAIAESEGQ